MTTSTTMSARMITLEGIEGVGKSTAVANITALLAAQGISVVHTREPGGTPWCESLRHILLHDDSEVIDDEAECMLMMASRRQHVMRLIRPALEAGKWVVCDRFIDATYAYQGGGRGLDFDRISALDDWVLQGFRPDLTLLLDAPYAVSYQRLGSRPGFDRIEREKSSFFDRVRQAYLDRAQADPDRIRVIDATQSLEQVSEAIRLQCLGHFPELIAGFSSG